MNMRRCELREKIARCEQKLEELLNTEEFSSVQENYIMNRVAAKPSYEDDNSV